MAVVSPFRALRPTPDAAGRVAAVPYDVVTTDEARALASGNPVSFLHVSRAEIDLPGVANAYDDIVYRTAQANFERLRRVAPLVMEDAPRLYVYRLRMGAHVQTGVAGGFSLDEYEAGVIKKHERTRRDKEDDRTRHIVTLRAQTGPVLLVHQASAAIGSIVRRITEGAALFDFTAADGVQHTVWVVPPRDEGVLIAAFAAVPALYIADGHHRAASAARARQELGRAEGTAAEGRDRFLAVAFPHDAMQILPYNRVVKDLNGLSPDDLLRRLGAQFPVRRGEAAPARRGEVSMFLDGRWYTIELGPGSGPAAAAGSLDVSRLQDAVLAPLLGIGDVRTDKRIDFVGGGRGTGELEHAVTSGAAAVAFSMYPVGIEDLMAISDAGGIMPPKSTWFEPKLRDGLLSHVI